VKSTRLLILAVGLLGGLLAPSQARAGIASMTVRELPLHGERTLAARAASVRFDCVGLHWRGSGTVAFRVRSGSGPWGQWREAVAESVRGGWWRSEGAWVGAADRIDVKTNGPVFRVRAFFVRSPELRIPLRRLTIAGSPPVVARSNWLADESIRRADPQYASRIQFAVVHHTAGANDYTAAQAPAIVRAIQIYHVKANGWNDIGYNALVDRYGVVYEGRYGGLDRNVVGAHARGFNTGSFGVAVLGDFEQTTPSPAALDGLAKVLAWRLDLAHIDPRATLTAISGGNERFQPGIPVFLRAIAAHRETGLTACPGDKLYPLLGELAGRAAQIGLPKLYEPRVSGSIGGQVRLRARLSGFLPWTVAITDAVGATVASTSGVGTTLDWTWDATLVPAGRYRWRIDGSGITPAAGTLGTGSGAGGSVAALAISGAVADPGAISPNDDGQADEATLRYTLTAPATVSVTALDAVGAVVSEVLAPTSQQAGEQAVALAGASFADGVYTLAINAVGGDGMQVSAAAQLLVTRTLGAAGLAPAVFSPNGDGRADGLSVRFELAGPADVKVRVLRDGKWVATPFAGALAGGPGLVRWDGTKRIGRLLDGAYNAVVEATDELGTSSIALPFASDTRRPVVRVLPGKPLRLWVSEPATLTIRISGRTLRQDVARAGIVRVTGAPRAGRVRAVAWDAAGNASLPAMRR
jgi:hypothetical protein